MSKTNIEESLDSHAKSVTVKSASEVEEFNKSTIQSEQREKFFNNEPTSQGALTSTKNDRATKSNESFKRSWKSYIYATRKEYVYIALSCAISSAFLVMFYVYYT